MKIAVVGYGASTIGFLYRLLSISMLSI